MGNHTYANPTLGINCLSFSPDHYAQLLDEVVGEGIEVGIAYHAPANAANGAAYIDGPMHGAVAAIELVGDIENDDEADLV